MKNILVEIEYIYIFLSVTSPTMTHLPDMVRQYSFTMHHNINKTEEKDQAEIIPSV